MTERPLVECPSCGGLKRASTSRCPHCLVQTASPASWLKRSLALAGLGAVAACGSSQTPTDAYGAPCFLEPDSGVCSPCGPGQSFNQATGECFTPTPQPDAGSPADGGLDGSIPDSGQTDAGPDSGSIRDAGPDSSSFVGADAYGIPPFRDAGPLDAGLDSGNDDD